LKANAQSRQFRIGNFKDRVTGEGCNLPRTLGRH
jgi:hypothetical protein